ncbi:hypothetical protein HN954_03660 [bacterium]|jgi:hypothetical protein|nr:hypothetical protein [bacterium]MBT6831473.1 hypothetical protein [bacterium]MBT6996498.1 hypothetical protein [bacterium]MBT7772706.1 hypothetical protein [bacterium]
MKFEKYENNFENLRAETKPNFDEKEKNTCTQRKELQEEIKQYFTNEPESGWKKWQKWQIDGFHKNAECPPEQIRKIEGFEFKLDAGATFVKVRSNDSVYKLSTKLRDIKPNGRDLSHLDPNAPKLKSINIPPDELQKNIWIPLPESKETRELTDKQFFNHCHEAIVEILTNDSSRDIAYKKELNAILDEIGEDNLLALMIAIAKQESGVPVGQFVFHRWESSKKKFAYSMFQILIHTDPKTKKPTSGLVAAQNMGMTPGQSMHPKNAAKLFIGKFCEDYRSSKPGCTEKDIAKYMEDLHDNPEKIAEMHNGKNWKTKNPKYANQIKQYLKDAHKIL